VARAPKPAALPKVRAEQSDDEVLALMHSPVRSWVRSTFGTLTRAQRLGMGSIAARKSTLLLAPTGSGKTLAAFLSALDRVMFGPQTPGIKVVYVSPLKALAVDIERNLRAPLVGIGHAAHAEGAAFHEPSLFVRSGDTPQKERAYFTRAGADIVITTPESLYLLLTSLPAKHFSTVETVIIDEIHALAPGKRGSHLWLTLERLEALRPKEAPPLQRIGLSATVRPLEPIARVLGGYASKNVPRPVEIVDAGSKRALDITIEVPVEDMRVLTNKDDDTGPSSPETKSIWQSIYPRLVELIRSHGTTLVFVNSRRLAERLSLAINELAGEEIALAHHGSIAHDQRTIIEDRLKAGSIPAIIATSSLELGIDMGAIDLVIQIEAPPTAAAGLQRVGRSGHRASAVSKGVIIPKFRADLLACAATAKAMTEGEVEHTFVPENPLDVLAQQIVAIVSMGPIPERELYELCTRAAPYRDLPRSAFEGVLDMVSGRYPSDEFAELRARLVWDRVTGVLTARHGARRIAILSGGTIPDRGTFGVFLDSAGKPVRIGELDEEMVFESRVGEVFLLGASSWRITDISHDRVLAIPAPGEAGKMPFWKGDRAGRPAELGAKIGALARKISGMAEAPAVVELNRDYGLDRRAAKNLVSYVHEQREATGEVPSDNVVVIERFRDELGDQRICILSPLGSRLLAPWAMAVSTFLRDERGIEVDAIWSDDGIVFRLPDVESAPDLDVFIPSHEDVEMLVTRGLDKTAMFATRFRENAARALLLPRRSPTKRVPLWSQRKRASDLLAVASRFGSFPIVLETYRECLKEMLDLPNLIDLLRKIEVRTTRVLRVDSTTPSPFASSLLFSYVANFIYDGDAPLAERRAQALTLDTERLRELLGEIELRELLDEEAIAETEAQVSRKRLLIDHLDHLHDQLSWLGDMTAAEIALRVSPGVSADEIIDQLVRARRALQVSIAGEARIIAVEDAGRYRDALGVNPPSGVPAVFLEKSPNALVSLVARFARQRGPFKAASVEKRFGLGPDVARAALLALVGSGKLVMGSFSPRGTGEEFVDADVLRTIKRRSLARLRKAVEPVPPSVLARFLISHHGIVQKRAGHEALLTAVEKLESLVLPTSVWFGDVFPARVRNFSPLLLDELCAAGEIVWRGSGAIGDGDGKIAFHLVDRLPLLAPPPAPIGHPLAEKVLEVLRARGAVFFQNIVAEVQAFAGDVLDAIWDLVGAGLVTNDTTLPLRSRFGLGSGEPLHGRAARFRTRRALPPGSEGRWSLLPVGVAASPADRAAALTNLLLDRNGVLTREVASAEGIEGGFSAIYPVLRLMEEGGRARRGYFVEGLGAAQFSRAGIEEQLRALREPPREVEAIRLAAMDPANPYGASVPWPEAKGARPARATGAHVVLVNGELAAFLGRGEQQLATFLPAEDPDRARVLNAVARTLSAWTNDGRRVLSIAAIDGDEAPKSPLAWAFRDEGFVANGGALLKRREGSYAKV